MPEPISIQLPAAAPERLILLFHGVGSTPESMVPLGDMLASAFPTAAVLSVPSPDPCDMGAGRQWFSVLGITEANRSFRVAATLPRFVATIKALQARTGVHASRTVTIGFSQGAIMSLEASQLDEPPAAVVVALSGRFARLPERAAPSTSIHLVHGDADPVIAVGNAQAGAATLHRLGAAVTLDVVPGLAHGIDERVARRVVDLVGGVSS